MAKKLNCWEFKKCGVEPGGHLMSQLEICPVRTFHFADGVNGGTNGGRVCWAIAGTFSGDDVRGLFARQMFSCLNCDFYQLVEAEEGVECFEILPPGIAEINKRRSHGKRKCVRFDVLMEATVRAAGDEANLHEVIVRNISAEGLMLEADGPVLKAGCPVEINIRNPHHGNRSVCAGGHIVWIKRRRTKWFAGLRFHEIAWRARSRLLDCAGIELT